MIPTPKERATLHRSPLWALDSRLIAEPILPEAAGVELAARLRARDDDPRAARRGARRGARPADVDPTTRVQGVAVIDVAGPLSNQPSIFRRLGLTDEPTLPEIARAVHAAAEHKQVRALLLRIASPGGTVFGTAEVADAVWQARQRKPVVAYVQDLGASAAYWIASQAETVVANRVAHVGSIGTFAVLVDQSRRAEVEGLRFHVIASAAHKGAGYPGSEVTEQQLEALREEIDHTARIFVDDVARGRGWSRKTAEGLHDGRSYVGERAVAVGLVDRVEPMAETLAGLVGRFSEGEGRSVPSAEEVRWRVG